MRRWPSPWRCCRPARALAQQDDRDYLTAFLEDNLSGAGRQVTITGFAGALSSRATMQRLQIADDSGVWITLDDVVLDWSRSSLLSGEVVVNELSAATITLARLPTAPDDGLPAPEATPFALPDLPVSVDIDALRADRIVLDPAVLGEPVEGRFQAALSLAGGEGSANLVLERTDGPESRIALDAAYSNATGLLQLDLTAAESAGGIAARMLGLPGEPSVDLAIRGEGPLTDFAAEVRLASDGTDRLSGPVTLTQDDGALRFAADLAGNLAPLFLPDYAAFLGDEVGLKVQGRRWPSGRMALDRLAMQARALALDGTLSLAADGLPQAFALTGRIGTPDSAPVLLPLPGEVRVTGADISLSFDAAKDNGWSGRALLTGLETGDLRLDRATLAGSGRIDRVSGRSGLGRDPDLRRKRAGAGRCRPATRAWPRPDRPGRSDLARGRGCPAPAAPVAARRRLRRDRQPAGRGAGRPG
jgi:translocation and assembly module TamB